MATKTRYFRHEADADRFAREQRKLGYTCSIYDKTHRKSGRWAVYWD